MKIRPLRCADIEDTLAIRLEVTENAVTPQRLVELDISAATLRDKLEGDYIGFAGIVQGAIQGFSMANKADAEIYALFVRPEYESQKIGSQLLDATLEHLFLIGHRRAQLATEKNTRAYHFYLGKNWRPIGENEQGEAVLEFTSF